MARARSIHRPDWGFDRYQRCEKCTTLTLHTELYELRLFDGSPARRAGEPFDPDRYLVCEKVQAGDSRGEYPEIADVERAVQDLSLQNKKEKAVTFGHSIPLQLLDPGLSPFKHYSLKELADSATSCDLCHAFWTFNGTLDTSGSRASHPSHDCELESQRAFCIVQVKPHYRLAKLTGHGTKPESERLLELCLCFAGGNAPETHKIFCAKFTHDITHNAHPQTLSRGLFRTHPFERIRGWLKACRESHSCTQDVALSPGEVRRSPSRLIDVGKGDDTSTLRLVEGVQDNTDYATLSYCWGPAGVPQKLLHSNYQLYSKNIPYDILPLTFQDAIDVTRALGLRYLWIDALCIIQNSKGDWHAEAPKMVDVYRFSAISLAASASDTVDGGLFRQRRKKDQPSASDHVVLGWSGRSFNSQPSLWANQMFKDPYESELIANPLSERGWVFQERFLAPRTVHFAREQIWFECRAECSNEVSTFDPSERRSYVAREMLEKRQWARLVEQYSLLKLTKITDKVVAFAGAADTYGRSWTLDPADYSAGMWRQDLPLHLLWYAVSGAMRPSAYVAPSWSWASVVSGVTFIDDAFEGETEWHESLEILDISMSLGSEARFGPVDGGSLELACHLHPASVESFAETYSVTISDEQYPVEWNPRREIREIITDQQRFSSSSELTRYCILYADDERALWPGGSSSSGGGGGAGEGHHEVALLDSTAQFFMPIVMVQHEWHDHRCLGIYGLLLSRSSSGEHIYKRSGLVRVFIGPGFDDTPDWWYVNGDTGSGLSDAGEDDNVCRITII